MQETQILSLVWEDYLEKEMTTHPSILAREIPQTERSCIGYSLWGPEESQCDLATEQQQ